MSSDRPTSSRGLLPDTYVQTVRSTGAARFDDVLSHYGHEVVRKKTLCPLHQDSDPSAHVYDDGHLYCYVCRDRLDAMGLVALKEGLDPSSNFRQLVLTLGDLLGIARPANVTDLATVSKPIPRNDINRSKAPKTDVTPLTESEQIAAVALFLSLIDEVVPESESLGLDYLATRGLRPETSHGVAIVRSLPVIGWRVPDEHGSSQQRDLYEHLLTKFQQHAVVLRRAGLLGLSHSGHSYLPWQWPTTLLVSLTPSGQPIHVTGRAEGDWAGLPGRPGKDGKSTPIPRYSHQNSGYGAALVPFGLPMVRRAALLGEELIIAEGPLDALGARQLGHHAIAMLGRPSVTTKFPLAPYLTDLLLCSRVSVVPDADDSEMGEGLVGASELVSWLRSNGVTARVATMADLGYQADGCKDFCDFAMANARP